LTRLKERGIDKMDIELLFQDEMRYGLISNYRRSWSLVGRRTELKNQQAYVNRYLYSSVAPVSGKSFHIMGLPDMNGLTMKVYLEKLREAYPGKHIVLIWDNAPCHRLRAFQEMEGITIVPLPSYSPQLNPAERFFGEMRKSTANRFFKTIASQEEAITEKVLEYADDCEKMKGLTGYGWILEQWERVF
jgi:transposase